MSNEIDPLDLEILGRLAPGVAHDFNNLLAAIGADADLARRALEPDHAAQESLESILATVAQGMGLTANVLAHSRPRPVQLREIDLHGELGALRGLLQRVAGEQLAVRFWLAEGPLSLQADPALLGQALFRLATLARRALSGKGELLIETRREGGTPCLLASASGPGLSSDRLGLDGERRAALQRLAEEHGAKLTVGGEPGCVTVRLDF